MSPEVLHLARALHAGASPSHLAALKSVRDRGLMWIDIDARKVAERENIKRSLWGWRAVRRKRIKLELTEMGSAILFIDAQRAEHDARTTQCAR